MNSIPDSEASWHHVADARREWGNRFWDHLSYSLSLNAVKGVVSRLIEGTIMGLTEGDAENLDYSLFVAYCSKAAAGMTLVSIRNITAY